MKNNGEEFTLMTEFAVKLLFLVDPTMSIRLCDIGNVRRNYSHKTNIQINNTFYYTIYHIHSTYWSGTLNT